MAPTPFPKDWFSSSRLVSRLEARPTLFSPIALPEPYQEPTGLQAYSACRHAVLAGFMQSNVDSHCGHRLTFYDEALFHCFKLHGSEEMNNHRPCDRSSLGENMPCWFSRLPCRGLVPALPLADRHPQREMCQCHQLA